MSFVAQCVFCKHKVKAPDTALGATTRCRKCDNSFTLAPMEEAPPEQVLARFRRPTPAAIGEAGSAQPGTDVLSDPASIPLPNANGVPPSYELKDAPDPARAVRRGVHLIGAVATLLGGAGLLCASLAGFEKLTIPLSAAGLVLGVSGTALAWLRVRGALFLPAAGVIVGMVVLTTALFFPGALGPSFAASRQRPTLDRERIMAVPLAGAPRGDATLQTEGWTDATRAALQQGPVRVQVASAAVAVVPFQGARPTFSKEKYLIVRLLIQHTGGGGLIDYAHWRAGDSDQESVRPTLTTLQGNTLPRTAFASAEVPLGQVSRVSLHPGRFLEDVLVFAAPEEKVEGLRLRLPATPWQGTGELKFLVPGAMIQR